MKLLHYSHSCHPVQIFDMKCEEYIVEVGINEKRLRESERERKTLNELLSKIINVSFPRL